MLYATKYDRIVARTEDGKLNLDIEDQFTDDAAVNLYHVSVEFDGTEDLFRLEVPITDIPHEAVLRDVIGRLVNRKYIKGSDLEECHRDLRISLGKAIVANLNYDENL